MAEETRCDGCNELCDWGLYIEPTYTLIDGHMMWVCLDCSTKIE
jgi:hypothetical protein